MPSLDLSKYRNAEIEKKIRDLLIFPKYAMKRALLAFLTVFFLFICSCFIIKFSTILGLILYVILGLFLWLVLGVVLTLKFVSSDLNNDISQVVNYSLDLTCDILKDVKSSKSNLTDKEVKLLFCLVISDIVAPMVTEIILSSVPIIGMLFSKLFNRFIKTVIEKIRIVVPAKLSDIGPNEDSILAAVNSIRRPTVSVVAKSFTIISYPIHFFLILNVGSILALIYLTK